MCFLADLSPRKKPSDSGTSWAVTCRKLWHFEKKLLKNPGQTWKTISNEVNLTETSKSTRCQVLGSLAKNVQPNKRPPLSSRHRNSWLDWTKYTRRQTWREYCSQMQPVPLQVYQTNEGRLSGKCPIILQLFLSSAGWRRCNDLTEDYCRWGFWLVIRTLKLLKSYLQLTVSFPILKRCKLNF